MVVRISRPERLARRKPTADYFRSTGLAGALACRVFAVRLVAHLNRRRRPHPGVRQQPFGIVAL